MRSTSCLHGATLVVSLSGRLTGAAGAAWLDQITTTRPSPRHVIVNLAAVTCVDREGANTLLDAYIATTFRCGTFSLTGPTALVGRQLDDFGISQVVVTTASGGGTANAGSLNSNPQIT